MQEHDEQKNNSVLMQLCISLKKDVVSFTLKFDSFWKPHYDLSALHM